jgi:hypothetical protein
VAPGKKVQGDIKPQIRGLSRQSFKISLQSVKDFFSKHQLDIDNKKFKDALGKGKMLGLEEVADITQGEWVDVCQSQ